MKTTTTDHDTIAQKHAAGQHITPEEFGAFGNDRDKLDKEANRLRRVANQRERAGTKETRAAAKIAATAVAKALATEEPKILRKLEELQATLKGLQAEARRTADIVEAQEVAVSQLRHLAPEAVRLAHNNSVQLINTNYKQFSTMRARIKSLKGLVALDAASTEQFPSVRAYAGQFPELRKAMGNGRNAEYAGLAAWNAHRAELQRELDKLEPEYIALAARREAELAALEPMLDYYVC